MEQTVSYGRSGAFLKHIAIITMIIDHIGYGIVERCFMFRGLSPAIDKLYMLLREIGRLAFPLFAFLIVEGAIHTSNRLRYFLSLVLFGIISEIPFNLFFSDTILYPKYQNVYITLALGLLGIYIYDLLKKAGLGMIFPIAFIGLLIAGFFLRADYGATGIILIFLMYRLRAKPMTIMILGLLVMTFLNTTEGLLLDLIDKIPVIWTQYYIEYLPIEIPSLIAFMLIADYNGQRGRQIPKYLYYIIYPAHLLILWILGGWIGQPF
ncbi:MAG: conjugal transfer protein TraX [Lachnospiraceae bacterium]|nr:conjugal transfer protein TraX [Lachnospiraceae bacterium]